MITKVYGAPGTGKTSWLINKLNEVVDGEEITLKDVVFVSFSNPAINEVCERTGATKGGFTSPYFRTLHGLCASFLSRTDSEIKEKIQEMIKFGFIEGIQAQFCRSLGIPYEIDEHGTSEALGNRAFSSWTAIVGEYYPKKRDLESCLDLLYDVDVRYGDIIEQWLKFKEKTGVLDFNDFLIEAYERDIEIDAKVGFFDEVQDFNRLEFEVVKKIISNLDEVYLAGDDDQAIYSWKGAKPEFFLEFEGEEIVLPKSWRVPSKVWEFANGIIRQVSKRRTKKIEPANEGGLVRVLDKRTIEDLTIEAAKLSMKYPSETFFLLFRTNKMVRTAEAVLLSRRVPFKKLKGWSIWDKELLMAWNVVAKLRGGIPLEFKEKAWLIENLKDEVLSPELKEVALKGLESGKLPLEFFEAIQKRDPVDLIKFRRKQTKRIVRDAWQPIEPEKVNLYVDTIHAAKGKEADVVILADAITSNIASSLRSGFRDSELRVFYVGITRARKAVFVAPLYKFKSFLTSEVLIYAR